MEYGIRQQPFLEKNGRRRSKARMVVLFPGKYVEELTDEDIKGWEKKEKDP